MTPRSMRNSLLLSLSIANVLLGQSGVTVAEYNNQRTNANLNETVLNTANVNINQFGRLFTRNLDGFCYARPLYVPNVLIPGHGKRNVVYVATLHNTVYAFDADDPAQSAPYWKITLANSIPFPPETYGGYVQPELGIMSTPAIDTANHAIYVVVTTSAGSNAAMYIYALDLSDGSLKYNSPGILQGHVDGSSTGYDRNPDGTITWNPNTRMQRAALLLANGNVYLGFSSYGAYYPYHGWIMAYSTTNLQKQVAVFNTTLNGQQGGVWQSGRGLAADANGSVYVMTGNGTYNGATDFGSSFVKLSPQLQVQDWFTPIDWMTLTNNDLDMGASGPMLFPNASRVVGGGKLGEIYVVNGQSMGHLESAVSHPIQEFQATPACPQFTGCSEIHSAALWTGQANPILYLWSSGDVLRGFRMQNGQFDPAPFSQSSVTSAYPGGGLTVSSNGGKAGSGIVWAMTAQNDSLVTIVPGTLRAFDATNLSHELWNSDMNPARDAMGNYPKFNEPVVANGRVYVPTFSNQLAVYGLLSSKSH